MPPKDKKIEKKESPSGIGLDPVEIVVVLIIIAALLTTLSSFFHSYISSGEISFFGFKLSIIFNFLKDIFPVLRYFAFGISGVLVIGTFVFNKKSDAIWAEEKANLYPQNVSASDEVVADKEPVNKKWEEIKKKSESAEESDWRLAIIEADIMLDSLLEKLNLPGMTMGDKLKAIEPSDFLTLDNAWEAHKARNRIAHQGSDFLLNQREVARIISLYESVFKEFKIV